MKQDTWERAKRYPILRLIGDGPHRRTPTGMTVLCPLHGDKHPSMEIREKDDGTWVWFCHAGCGGGSVVDLFAKMHGIKTGKAAEELAGDGAIPPPPPARPRERGMLPLVCDQCGEGRDRAVKPAEVFNRVELLEALGWYIFPNHGPDIGRAVFCPRHADKALAYAAGIMLGDGVVPDDGPPSGWVRIARAG